MGGKQATSYNLSVHGKAWCRQALSLTWTVRAVTNLKLALRHWSALGAGSLRCAHGMLPPWMLLNLTAAPKLRSAPGRRLKVSLMKGQQAKMEKGNLKRRRGEPQEDQSPKLWRFRSQRGQMGNRRRCVPGRVKTLGGCLHNQPCELLTGAKAVLRKQAVWGPRWQKCVRGKQKRLHLPKISIWKSALGR